MAEINYNNLYNQLSPMDKLYYDQQFSKNYVPGQENIMLSSQPSYEQMKAAYDAKQKIPKKSFLESINPFSSASAAEMPTFDLGTGITNTTAATNMYSPYQDKIMGGVRGDPNPFGYQNQINDFVIDNEDYQEIPGFNFRDAPTSLRSRIQNPQFLNNPRTGFIDNTLMQRGNPGNSIIDKARSGIGKGFNLGKSAIGGIASLIAGVPGIGALLGMLPERDYRQNTIDNFYSDPSTRGLMSQIPGMDQYNTVSGGLLNMLTGGEYGEPTKYGLSGAIDKRMATIQKTLGKKKSAVLEQRLKDLQELKTREAKALADAQAKQAANLESQRIGRRPSAPSGDGGTKDSGGPTGGYSYDSGGREGFGYGLKNGGLAGLKRKGFKGGGADMGDPGRAQERADRGYGSTGGVDRPGNNNNNNNNNMNEILKNVASLNASNITKPELFLNASNITKPKLFFNQNLPFNVADLKGKIFMDNILDNDDIQLDSQFSTNLLPGFNTTTKITEQGIGPTSLSYNNISALIDQNKNLQNMQYNKGPLSVGYGGDGNYFARLGINFKDGGLAGLL
jgi:hypothetical protein